MEQATTPKRAKKEIPPAPYLQLKKLSLKNFKCFEDATIELGKITLLTGANSSGKSSAIHALLGIMQTSEFPLRYSPNGRYAFMGDYQDIIKDHKVKSTFSINLLYSSMGEDYSVESEWGQNPTNKLPELVRMHLKGPYLNVSILYLPSKKRYRLDLEYFKDRNTRHDEQRDMQRSILRTVLGIGKGGSSLMGLKKKSDVDRYMNFDAERVSVEAAHPSEFEIKLQQEAGFMHLLLYQHAGNLLTEMERRFNYIGSFRYEPEKTRDALVRRTMKVRRNGENYEDQIITWKEDGDPQYSELVNELSKLKLLQGLKPKRNRGGTYSLEVKTGSHGVFSGLHNVGFGLSQFAPIVVADLQLPKESLLAVSQPEVHLHPSAQASFADYLVRKVTSHDKRYLIETHSEYLLNRLRLLIVKGMISPEEVRVLHFSKKGRSQVVQRIFLRKDGSIDGAPKDFFDTYLVDSVAIAMNA